MPLLNEENRARWLPKMMKTTSSNASFRCSCKICSSTAGEEDDATLVRRQVKPPKSRYSIREDADDIEFVGHVMPRAGSLGRLDSRGGKSQPKECLMGRGGGVRGRPRSLVRLMRDNWIAAREKWLD